MTAKNKVYRPDGSWYHTNVRPSRQTKRRKEKREAVKAAKSLRLVES